MSISPAVLLRLRTLLVAAAIATVGALWLGIAPALAAKAVSNAFGGDGTGAGQFQTPSGVAVNQATGDVYVADVDGQRVQQFDADGTFIRAWGWGVATGADAFEVCTSGCQAGIAGSGSGQFAFQQLTPEFLQATPQLAVDQSDGSVYVADTGNHRIQKFSAAGAIDLELGSAGQGDGELALPQGVAVDPATQDVYVADSANNRVQRFDSAGAYQSQFGSSGSQNQQLVNPSRLAVDSDGDVYVVDAGNSAVKRFGGVAGAFEAIVASGAVPFPRDVAVNPADDHLLVAGFDSSFTAVLHELDTAANVIDSHAAGAGFDPRGLAVRSSTGRIYLASANGNRVLIAEDVTPPTATVEPVDGITASSAVLHGQVNPQGSPTRYHFEYSSDDGATWVTAPGYRNEFGNSACEAFCPEPVDVGAGTSNVAVSQSTGSALDRDPANGGQPIQLQPNTTYRVRLVATKPFNAAKTISDETTFTTAGVGPEAQTRNAAVGITTARVAGRVHPHNSPTTYYFEYSTQPDFSDSLNVPAGQDGNAGAANDWTELSQPLTGLAAGTTYHYRIVAHSAAGDVTGNAMSFITHAAPPPAPAGRAYEKVSPDVKGDLGIRVNIGTRALSPDGDRATLLTGASVPGAPQSGPNTLFVERTAEGWQSEIVDLPKPNPGTSSTMGTSDDVGFYAYSLSDGPGGTPGLVDLFLRDNDSGQLRIVSSAQGEGNVYDQTSVTADGAVVAFSSPVPQTADAVAPATSNVYVSRDGEVRLAGVLPEAEGGGAPPNGSWLGAASESYTRALARDGNRVAFTVPNVSGSSQGELYVREDDGVSAPETIHVNASQRSTPDPAGPLPATYWLAEAEHGSKVLFSSCEKLTDDSTADASGLNCKSGNAAVDEERGGDLYLFDVESGELTDLTTQDPSGADLRGVVGASDDLSTIYFVASGVLANGARPGEPNLYVHQGGSTRYIAALGTGGGYYPGQPTQTSPPRESANWALNDRINEVSGSKLQAARVTPDGQHALITSYRPLTGYDNRSPERCDKRGVPGDRCAELFLYSFASRELTCVSCPEGQTAGGDAMVLGFPGLGGQLAGFSRNLSDDGKRVFFQTGDTLVPRDINGKLDVYEWDSGVIRLVSGGEAGIDSLFVDASPNGDDVLFSTTQRLVASDHDDAPDVYDARVGGGFPETPPTVPCEGDDCQGSPNGGPALPAPATGVGQAPEDSPVAPGRIRAQRLRGAQLSALALGRAVALKISVNRAGRVTVRGTARVSGRRRVVLRGSRRVGRPGRATVRLRLSRAGRAQLLRRRRLTVSLSVAFSGARSPSNLTIHLERKGR